MLSLSCLLLLPPLLDLSAALQVMRFDILATPPVNGPLDAAKRSALTAALRADYKATVALLPAPTKKRQVCGAVSMHCCTDT
jgi:hypothetical protein